MKMTRCILGIFILSAALLTGCMKEDIDELRAQQAENADRITALEEWQASVNSQIGSLQSIVAALENYDYVTGVTPVTEGGVEVGYTITFTKSSPITIYHGEKGDKGDKGDTGATGADGHSPIVGVAKDTDGKYYWTLDGNWMLDGSGAKIPVTGADGLTPVITIGANGNWFVDGVDTGVKAVGTDGTTPTVTIGANGNWYINGVDSGVKATGDAGADAVAPQVKIDTDSTSSTYGEWLVSTDGGTTWTSTGVTAQGDSIFAANGVDNTSDDYVVFTLADGTTTITIPKYKTVGISFTQPTLFNVSTTQTITYTSTGTTEPTNVRVVDVPAGWKVTVNMSAKTFTITAPSAITTENFEGEATVLIADGDRVAAMYGLNVRGAGFLRVGDYYPDPCAVYENGVLVRGTPAIGVVFWLDNHVDGDHPYDKVSGHGKIVGLYERAANHLDETWATNYGTTYNAGTGWYMPLSEDSSHLYCAYNGMSYETWNTGKPSDLSKNDNERGWFRAKITDAGGDNITDSWYWAKPRNATTGNALRLHFNSGNKEWSGWDLSSNKTRAIKDI